MSKFKVTKELCVICNKTVYYNERVQADNKVYHQDCFKCHHCHKNLSLGNYSALGENFYCKPHFMELFKKEGKYNFGKEGKKRRKERREKKRKRKKRKKKKRKKKKKLKRKKKRKKKKKKKRKI